MTLEAFKSSRPLSLGIELELQILDTYDYDLTPMANDLLYWVSRHPDHPGNIVPEMTQGMIELSTGIHHSHATLVEELRAIRDFLGRACLELNLALSGGGTHASQHWADTRIFEKERFHYLSELYGYLAKQFTIFGQHIHIGCPAPDEALFLLHSLSRYIPHFIALSASSPYVQGVDTGFASARLNSVFAFPLSGRAPFVESWEEFGGYFEKMTRTGVVQSMKDFYWDIRPKPEYGTIEIRVCDTPLTVDHAADLAAYLQALSRYLIIERPIRPTEDDYLVYGFNRFQACRFGADGVLVDPKTGEHHGIRDDILATLDRIEQHAIELGADAACRRLRDRLVRHDCDAAWCRAQFAAGNQSAPELMRAQAQRWLTS
ncbi:MAG TPA: YbdK family carboxylate-amine ligase [Rhodocyclaceae bacterium]|nr:YbdK family carboxylate-amine ligase [Rhodocyclaceae bacterium]